ncbi:MAG: DUF503 domain-containing protein [bacterium]|nr:DUF503 domain-containing protein [bacterium]
MANNQRDGFLGWSRFELHFPFAHSLKEKRSILHSVKDKLKSRTGASIAEVGETEHWQTATLVCAIVANDSARIEEVWREQLAILQSQNDLQIVAADKQWR